MGGRWGGRYRGSTPRAERSTQLISIARRKESESGIYVNIRAIDHRHKRLQHLIRRPGVKEPPGVIRNIPHHPRQLRVLELPP